MPKSAWFCFVRTYFQFIKPFSFILATRLQTSTLDSPLSFNQCKVTVLPDHAYTSPILNLLRLHFKLPAKFEDTCAAKSFSHGIDKLVRKLQCILRQHWHH